MLREGPPDEYDAPEKGSRGLTKTKFVKIFLISFPAVTDPAIVKDRADLVRAAQEAGRKAFQAKLDYLRDTGRRVGIDNLPDQALAQITIGVIDEKWKDHLYDLDQLRDGIYYRAWGQKDPLVEYKQE